MSNSRLEQIYKPLAVFIGQSIFVVVIFTFSCVYGDHKVFVSVFVTLGAEDLCPSLQPSWVRPVPYRTAQELYLYPASFRFIFVLG